ncbi:hypothetical protein [Paenibacillus sp. NAIST15-1]|uniref:hypothetical protein n=1 Tax=Paenibacillus sp. NAIST15-1 TaxID=1605994 RepID=UPI00086BD9DB|nr:hypothetical protein [Paenibacillus sp. NAIST15-1]GAV14303.1 hypothetical protein PBN151_4265 [Paenibacillus sp. NAIST15-1]
MRSNKKLLAALTAFSMLFAPLITAWTDLAKESTNKGIKSNGQVEIAIADLDAQKAQRAMKQLTGKEVELEAASESKGTT